MQTGKLSQAELTHIAAAFGVPTFIVEEAAKKAAHVFRPFITVEPSGQFWGVHSTPTLDKYFYNVSMSAANIWKVEEGYKRVVKYYDEVRQQEKDRKRHCIR